MLLRIDDLETPRTKPGADVAAVEDLRWLGLFWNGDPIRQSKRQADYANALADLTTAGLLYGCACTRSELERDATTRADDGAVIYGGRCRDQVENGDVATRRLRIDGVAAWNDGFFGSVQFVAADIGDIVVRRHNCAAAYQLASVVDDLALGVTHVIRGADLLASTARQIFIARALGREDELPAFIHLPLVRGPDGRKLAKRHGDTRLSQLRDEGVTAGQVRALLARLSGIETTDAEMSIAEWVRRFRLNALPRADVQYDDAVDRPLPLSRSSSAGSA